MSVSHREEKKTKINSPFQFYAHEPNNADKYPQMSTLNVHRKEFISSTTYPSLPIFIQLMREMVKSIEIIKSIWGFVIHTHVTYYDDISIACDACGNSMVYLFFSHT